LYPYNGCIRQTFDGGYVVGMESGLDYSVWYHKLNADCEIINSFHAPTQSVSTQPKIIQTTDSNFICMYTDLPPDSINPSIIKFVKLDNDFNLAWIKETPGHPYYAGQNFMVTDDHSLLATGWASSEGPVFYDYDILVFKLEGDIVPVELIAFAGRIENNKIFLNWETATETNNYGFDVERSQDKLNWKKIAFVHGNITSTNPHSYTFIDSSRLLGVIYYRLKQIDLDGSFTYSNEIKIISNPVLFSLEQNYPNPFNPITAINYSIPENENVSLEVYNILGQKIMTLMNEYKMAGYYSINFNAGEFASGVYIYRLTAGRNNSTKKMLLLK
jgi:Secretion system C-terminal sorting domain